MSVVIIGALLPVVLTLLLGALAGIRHDENAKAAGALNRMVLDYALPLALFAGTAGTSRTVLLAQGPLALALFLGSIIPFLLVCAIRYRISGNLGAAALQGMGFGFPAIPFTATAILTPLVGREALLIVGVGGTVLNVTIIPLVLVCLAAAGSLEAQSTVAHSSINQSHNNADSSGLHEHTRKAVDVGPILRKALLTPIVIAPVLALALVLFDFHLPNLLLNSLHLLGDTVGGVALFASGIILQAQRPAISWTVITTTLGRNLVVPGLACLLLSLFHVDPSLRKVATLALALPAAALQITFAVQHETQEQENASFLLYSNFLSVFSIAFFVWLTR